MGDYLLDKYDIKFIINTMKSSRTMTEASEKLNVGLSTLKRYCYKNNLTEYYKTNIELYDYDDDTFINICENSLSMLEASKKMNIPFSSFIRRAKKLKCYKTNMCGKNVIKLEKKSMDDIISGKITITTNNLKKKLFSLNIKERKCEKCNCSEIWMDEPITLELHHINGDNKDNRLENLQILCPNCHSQTITYRSRDKRKMRG